MTREVYNMLSQILDHLEEEVAQKKTTENSEEIPHCENTPNVRIKIDMTISIE